jgi:nucleoside-diphosphate-sugar epimerase
MVLVTGGTGFVGAHLLLELLKNNQKVKAIKRNNSNLNLVKRIFSYYKEDVETLLSQIEWVDGDVLDVLSLQEAMENVEKVYHCAAVVSFSPKDRDNLFKTNIKGTANVVNTALQTRIKKLCFVSSIAAIGRSESNELTSESTEWKSSKRNSTYAISKYEAEKEVWRGIEEGLNAVIGNPSVILGPGDWNNGSAKIFDTLKNGTKFYTEGVNGFVDVRDVASVMYQLMESEIVNERFIVSSENLSYRELFTLILNEYGIKPPTIKALGILLEAAWRFEKLRGGLLKTRPLITKETVNTAQNQYFYSTEKLQNAIDFKFTPVKEIIKLTAALYKKEKR